MHLSPHDPFRPVDWRYRRAEYLRSSGKYRRSKLDDGYVLVTRKFLKQREKCQDESDYIRLADKMPGIYYAGEIYTRTETTDKYILEARILAGSSIKDIAKKHAYTPEVIFWYEKLFFDVRDKLDKRDYLISRVIGPAAHRGIAARDFDLMLKMYALVGGPYVVDALVEQRSGIELKPQSEKELDVFFNKDCASTIKRNAAIASRSVRINEHTLGMVLEAHGKLLDIERQTETTADTSNLIMQNIQATLQAVPFHISSKREVSNVLAHYDKSGVELRANELALAGVGVDPGVEQELQYYKFPEQVKEETDNAGTNG